MHHLAVASDERDQAIRRVDETSGELRGAQQCCDRLHTQNKQAIKECLSLRSKLASSLAVIKAYQDQIQAQEDHHATERERLQLRLARMASQQSELQQLLTSATTRTRAVLADAVGRASGACNPDAAIEDRNELAGVVLDPAETTRIAFCATPDPYGASAAETDPVQSAKAAVAQLAALAGILTTHQVLPSTKHASEAADTATNTATPTNGSPGPAAAFDLHADGDNDDSDAVAKINDTDETTSSLHPNKESSEVHQERPVNQAPASRRRRVGTGAVGPGSVACSVDQGDEKNRSRTVGDAGFEGLAERTCVGTNGPVQLSSPAQSEQHASSNISHAMVEGKQTRCPKKWEELQRLDWLLRVQGLSANAVRGNTKLQISLSVRGVHV